MGKAASNLYETRRGEIIPDFFKSIHDFSKGGWHGGDYAQKGYTEPHLLRADYLYNDRYLSALGSVADDVLRNTYEDGGAHRYYSLQALFNHSYERKPLHQCSNLFPEVEQIISVGPEVRTAFETIFGACQTFEKSVADIPGNTKKITREQHGFTQEQTDQLQDALKTVWKAYPETDPRISEGFDYVMSDPLARRTFTFPEPLDGSIGYRFEESSSDNRSDYRLTEMLAQYDGRVLRRQDVCGYEVNISSEGVSAIAQQTVKNLNKLQAFSVPIAERCLHGLLKAVCKDAWRTNSNTARHIFDNLASGKTSIKTEAGRIRSGKYGALRGGYRAFFQKNNERKGALFVANQAEDYLQFCLNIHSGGWFEQECNRITALGVQKNLPGFSAPVSQGPSSLKAISARCPQP